MKVEAKGMLRHRFWGVYSAAIALQFSSADDAKAALPVLGDGWKLGEKHQEILIWEGESKALDLCSDLLESFGADRKKIASIATSIDHGEWFQVTIPVENKNQLALF
jgi:hypothetical protein